MGRGVVESFDGSDGRLPPLAATADDDSAAGNGEDFLLHRVDGEIEGIDGKGWGGGRNFGEGGYYGLRLVTGGRRVSVVSGDAFAELVLGLRQDEYVVIEGGLHFRCLTYSQFQSRGD